MSAPEDPIARFLHDYARAQASALKEPTAVALATPDATGRPSVRMVLLKGVDERGFVFYTNFESRKGEQLAENPHAALCFYWPTLDEQVRVEGEVERVSEEESDAYFASRERGSQIGAWASEQSRPLASRGRLVARYLQLQARYAGRTVPRPSYWGGFRLAPARIEFWHNQLHRLHDRMLYLRTPDGWSSERLYP